MMGSVGEKEALHDFINNNNNKNEEKEKFLPKASSQDYKWDIAWINVLKLSLLHYLGWVGFYHVIFTAKFLTLVLLLSSIIWTGIVGVSAGAHRLWAHKSYKTTTPIKIVMMLAQTLTSQNCLWIWVRDHRLHHKHSDTDADPHNATRGFFFSHMGWLLVRKHPEVKIKGASVDMSDMDADPIVMFQKRYYYQLYAVLTLAIVSIPWYFWGEDFINSFIIMFVTRLLFELHGTWSVNSWAHKYGTRPFNKNILAVETTYVSLITMGEGWHNYHHTFPWDYKASELGKFSWTTDIIDSLATLGWAYDLKSATKEMIKHRVNKYGDGTREIEYEELIKDMGLST